jgi:hypothetical protein
VLSFPGALNFLIVLGFVPVKENSQIVAYQYEDYDENFLKYAIYILKQELDSMIILEVYSPV